MSKFDLDKLLKDLGVPQNAQDRTPADHATGTPEPQEALPRTVDDAAEGHEPPAPDTDLGDEDAGACHSREGVGAPANPLAAVESMEAGVRELSDEVDALDGPPSLIAPHETSGPTNGTDCDAADSGTASCSSSARTPSPGSAPNVIPAFIRTDPTEVPRPPDSTGSGLDKEVDVSRLVAEPDGRRVRPGDALQLIWEPPGGRYCGIPGMQALPDVVLERNIVSASQLKSARTVVSQNSTRRLVDVLVEMGTDDTQLQEVVAELHAMAFVRLPSDDVEFDPTFSSRLGTEYCKANQVLPISRDGRAVVIGTTRPDDLFLLDEVKRQINARVIRHVLVTYGDIARMLDLSAPDDPDSDVTINQLMADLEDISTDEASGTAPESDDPDGSIEQADDAPIIKTVFLILRTAVKEGASDIHIEPEEKKSRVRFRIDGQLFEMMNLPRGQHGAILSRMKIISNLDIAERRLPQDGRTRYKIGGRQLDFRVSTLPTIHGEKCVIRILDDRSISVGLSELGFEEQTLHIWSRQIDQPHGIILVTGPTGSGKTTTLYSSLRQMDVQHLNVSTVEDPVEYHLDGVSQVQIHERIGMTFAAALRSLLRQDPDVVMVGEIRDGETARIAVQAALTGHLVLSTLHTNDAPSSVTRLINIGVEGFLIGAALNGVLAQRLVRKICTNCKEVEELSEDKAEFLALQGISNDSVFHGKGCDRCRETGYSGRSGIYELLVLDDVTRDAIARNPNVTEFRRMCIERGMVTLRQDGIRKVVSGITTIDEVMRVTEATI